MKTGKGRVAGDPLVVHVTGGMIERLGRFAAERFGEGTTGAPVSSLFLDGDAVARDAAEAVLRDGVWAGSARLADSRIPCSVRVVTAGESEAWIIEPAKRGDDASVIAALADIAFEAMFVTELDGTIMYVNRGVNRIYGYGPSELIGENARIFVDPSHPLLLPVEYGVDNLIHKEPVQRVHRRKDGTSIIVNVVSDAFELDGRTLILGVVRDESDRQADHDAMVGFQRDLQFIIDSIPAVIMQMDKDLNIIRANSFSRMLSGAGEKPLGTNFRDVNAVNADAVVEELLEVARTGRPILGTQRKAEFPDGRTVWVNADKIPHFDAGGHPDGVLFFVTDITRIKQVEESLERHAAELEAANETLRERIRTENESTKAMEQVILQRAKLAQMGEMLQGVAHQWQQPLTIISLMMQNVQLMDEKDRIDPAIRRAADESLNQVKFMSRTIKDFMAFLLPGDTEEDFNVLAAVSEVVELNRVMFSRDGIAVSVGCEDCDAACAHEHLIARGLPGGFKQVIFTLMQNARQAVTAAIRRGDVDPLSGYVGLDFSCDADNVYITVSDNGGGVPEDIIDRVFDPYVTTRKDDGGTGLGLYMARSIVEKNLGGGISVENIGPGAVFTLTLTLAVPGRKGTIA